MTSNAANPNAAKRDADNLTTADPKVSGRDAARQGAANQNTTKQGATDQDLVSQNTANQDVANQNAANQDAAKQSAGNQDPVKQDALLPQLTARDLITDVWLDLVSRPGRTLLTMLGTLIGIAVLVSTLGLSASFSAQLASRFDELSATQIVVSSVTPPDAATASFIPPDAPARALRITGTRAAATLTEVKGAGAITGTPVHDPLAISDTDIPLYTASAGLADVIDAEIRGTFFSQWHDASRQPVAVLGRNVADRLNVFDVTGRPVIFIDSKPLVVVGIIDGLTRESGLLQAVIVPYGYANAYLAVASPEQLLIRTMAGAAGIVGEQAGVAIRPDHPDFLTVAIPPEPELTRAQITGDAQGLFVVLAIVSLLIGGVGIANMTLVSVMERVPEIGLRRAVGARRRHIIVQFIAASVVTGFGGGILGCLTGAIATLAVSAVQQWSATLPWWLIPLSPILGAAIGLVAGAYPARRASRIEPIDALRAS